MPTPFIRKITDAQGRLLRYERVTEIIDIIYPEQIDNQLTLAQQHTDTVQALKDSLTSPQETIIQNK